MPKRRYKLHLQQDDLEIPRTTRWRHQQQSQTDVRSANDDNERSIDEEESSADNPSERLPSDEDLVTTAPERARDDAPNLASGSNINEAAIDPPNPQESRYENGSDSDDVHLFSDEASDGDASIEQDHVLQDDNADELDPRAAEQEALKAKYHLDDRIPPSQSDLTIFEVLLLILQISMRFSIPKNGIKALIELVNLSLGTCIISPSNYLFSKVFKPCLAKKLHFFCAYCLYYAGAADPLARGPIPCPSCDNQIPRSTSGSCKNFFLSLSIEDQIRMQLEEDGDAIINYRRNRQQNPDSISDVFDGELFAALTRRVQLRDTDITISFNTDGSPVFKSTAKSLWPGQFRINEIPPEKRFSAEGMMLSGVWFSPQKMSMSTYLTPFIKEMQKLSTEGIRWYSKEQKKFIITRVFLLHSCVDTVAKPKLLNMKQFNGKYGCYLCYHKGDDWDGDGNIRYSSKNVQEERTDESTRSDMLKAHQEDKVIKGVKGPSPFMALQYFSMTYGTVVDYMHSHLLGVCKYICTHLWVNSSTSMFEYHLSNNDVQKIDRRLLQLKPPKDISRDIKAFSKLNEWKANECRSWAFFYGPVCLEGILPAVYFRNFCELVTALYLLNKSKIAAADLNFAAELLVSFTSGFERLYGLKYMTYNVHLSTHLIQCVRMNGPLWAYSLFPYEAGNGFLVSIVQGTNGVPQQVVENFATYFSLPTIVKFHPPLNHKVVHFSTSIMNFARFKKASTLGSITIVGEKRTLFLPSEEETTAILAAGLHAQHFFEVKKIITRGLMFISHPHSSPKKNDAVVQLSNGTFGKIEKFFTTDDINNEGNVFASIRIIRLKPPLRSLQGINFSSQIRRCEPYPYEALSIVNAKDLAEKCVFLSHGLADFLIEFPNKFEKD